MFKKLLSGIGSAAQSSWAFFKGKKRYITIAAGLLSKVLPEHTAVGQGANFITANIENINIVLEVVAGLFGSAVVVEAVVDNLPSGLADKTKAAAKGLKDKIKSSTIGE